MRASETAAALSGTGAFSLHGRVAVVTGAARGIGQAAAATLAGHGAAVVLVDRLAGDLHSTAAELAAAGATVETVAGDVSRDELHEPLCRAAAALGPVSILVNAAGVMDRMDVTELTPARLGALWQVNVLGTVAVTQLLLPQMISAGYGKIINVGSLGSVRGLERRTAYAATKGAVAQYTISLAAEAGSHGIRANVVAPGYVATDMASSWMYDDPERTQRLLSRIPLGRFAVPADLAGTFVFLAAPASDYITGQVLLVDGGWTTT
jgi:NAD(P)-dependent dehydrogenase (short-subunit alcohol dehydrogenase family)